MLTRSSEWILNPMRYTSEYTRYILIPTYVCAYIYMYMYVCIYICMFMYIQTHSTYMYIQTHSMYIYI